MLPSLPANRTILMLASSPVSTARLRLDKEAREIRKCLESLQQKDQQYALEYRWAVRPDELRRALLDVNPEIVHFCGHGVGNGLVLENDAGEAQVVSTEALTDLFKMFQNIVKCVVLNACLSKVQADTISQYIDYVIGMNEEISDKAAIKFAVGFYDAIATNRNFTDAFAFGCNAIQLESIPEHLTPVLKQNKVFPAVQEARSRLCYKIEKLYRYIQLLNLQQIDVEKLYVDVYLLSTPSNYYHATIEKLQTKLKFAEISETSIQSDLFNFMEEEIDFNALRIREKFNLENNFNRLGLEERKQRFPSLKAIEIYQNLIVLGKPGSGKSTFLKHIAVLCCNNHILKEYIPVLIELRSTVDSMHFNLIDIISQETKMNKKQIKHILEKGRVLILLDGLDELPVQKQEEVKNYIINFLSKYYDNRIIITCRTQTVEFILPSFTYVEIADFKPEQVRLFAYNWFMSMADTPEKGNDITTLFTDKLSLPENKQAADLAVTPILLSLTCWVFNDLIDFPPKRSAFYEHAINLLLGTWDKRRGIQRNNGSETYRNLSTEDKKKLLGYIAFRKFEQGQFTLFEQHEIQTYIAEHLNISCEDSETVLKAIEAQHGLLIERAYGIWSFSHLTFQEYFVAKRIVDTDNTQILSTYVLDTKWQEVFLLTTELMHMGADKLLLHMSEKAQSYIRLKKILDLFEWAEQKSRESQSLCKAVYIRIQLVITILKLKKGFLQPLVVNLIPILRRIQKIGHFASLAKKDRAMQELIEEFYYRELDVFGKIYQANPLFKDISSVTSYPFESPLEFPDTFDINVASNPYLKYGASYLMIAIECYIAKIIDIANNYEKFNLTTKNQLNNFTFLLQQLKDESLQQLFDGASIGKALQIIEVQYQKAWFDLLSVSSEIVDLSKPDIEAIESYFKINNLIFKCKQTAVNVEDKNWQTIEQCMFALTNM